MLFDAVCPLSQHMLNQLRNEALWLKAAVGKASRCDAPKLKGTRETTGSGAGLLYLLFQGGVG